MLAGVFLLAALVAVAPPCVALAQATEGQPMQATAPAGGDASAFQAWWARLVSWAAPEGDRSG